MRAATTFRANLKVENNRLIAVRVEADESGSAASRFLLFPIRRATGCALPCQSISTSPTRLPIPSRLKPGQELWVEVTVPPKGQPRPMQVALKQDGVWKPLAFE